MKRALYTIGFALLFYVAASVILGLAAAFAGFTLSVAWGLVLVVALVAGGWYGWSR